MYDYVLFDMDGTVSDSSLGITKGMQLALRTMGVEEELENLKQFIGPPAKYTFRDYYGFDEETGLEAMRIYREYYGRIGLFENKLYPGFEELLKRIKASGRKIAVATSKPENFTVPILKKFGIYDYFDEVAGAIDGMRVDKCDVIDEALKRLGNPDKTNVVLVGDTRFDAEGAAKSGIDCIGVLYGFGSEESLREAGAKYIAETVEDVFKYL